MSRINLPTHPLDPSRKLMYGNVPVSKLTRREALELIGLIASAQIEEVQDMGLNWYNPHRVRLTIADWRFATSRFSLGLTAQPTSENTCATGDGNEPPDSKS